VWQTHYEHLAALHQNVVLLSTKQSIQEITNLKKEKESWKLTSGF